MDDLVSWQDWFAHGCYLVLAISYIVTSIWWLRLLAIISLGCEGVYFYFAADVPLWTALGWSAVFVAINLAQLAILTRHALRRRWTAEERLLRTGLLAGLDPMSLARLLKAGTWTDFGAGTVLTREGEPVENVYLLVGGEAAVETGSRTVAVLRAGSIAGEMSFLSGLPASATVTTLTECRAFVVRQCALRTLMQRCAQLRLGLHERFNRELVGKLRYATQAG
jgi:CRP-like cAMP-binding protein